MNAYLFFLLCLLYDMKKARLFQTLHLSLPFVIFAQLCDCQLNLKELVNPLLSVTILGKSIISFALFPHPMLFCNSRSSMKDTVRIPRNLSC